MAVQIGTGRFGGFELRCTLPGMAALAVSANRFADEVSDFRPFWNGPFKAFWYEERRRDFATEGRATGSAWAPLSPAYAKWKSEHFPGKAILTRSGQLRASLEGPSADGSVWRDEPKALTVGTTVPYGIYHQTGTRRMPQRPPLRIDQAFRRVVGKQLQAFVVAAWKRRRAIEKVEGSIQAS